MKDLLREIRACTICKEHLPFAPKPVLRASSTAKIVIIGQAPGSKVQQSGIPWDDASGKTLREWMDISSENFYDESKIAIIPMGFCYPGKGKTGDLPPRKECAATWHDALFEQMPNIKLKILIGQYANSKYLNSKNLTQTVGDFEQHLPDFFSLPHPSPRNRIWLKRNPWFHDKVVPQLQEVVFEMLNETN